MLYKVVTCFDENKLKQNGSRLLDQFRNNWQPSIEFHCYYYNMDIANYSLPQADNIKYHDLSSIEEYATFVESNKEHDGTEKGMVAYTDLLDGLGASPKVFAISECAFENKGSWLLWIDPLALNLKDIRTTTLDRYFLSENNEVDFVSIPDNDHLMGFNIGRQTSVDLLGDWRGSYMSGEYRNYREWGSSFILSRFVTIYNAHGMSVKETEDLEDIFVNLRNRNMQAARDSSGNRIVPLSDSETSPDILPNRYRQLADVIRFYKPKTILETGTWNGGRAIEMALASFDNTNEVHYIGYDLFEDATTQTDKEEFNAKPHNTKTAVIKRLDEFAEHMKIENNKKFTYELYKGNVKNILDEMYVDEVDLALIGSGNSEKTVQHEYSILKNVPVVVGDHYFTKDDEEGIPPEEYQGIKKVFDKVTTKKVDAQETTKDGWTNFDEEATTRKYVLPSSDKVAGGGHTHLVIFLHDAAVADIPDELKRVPIVVHPRDCVSKDYIKNNIQTNTSLIDSKKWISKHPPHRQKGIVVSAGPYLDYKKLKSFIKKNPTARVLTVKHAYPNLLKNNISPWGCIVLDPRAITGKSTHNIVRKDLFATVDPQTNFFVASMTDPSVTNHLIDNGARIWGWHAYTDSLRDENAQGHSIQNQQVRLNEDLGIPKGATLITGGTCAAMRSIGMLHTMGFRDIHLFGFDCCREEPTKEEMTETVGDIDGGETPKPKYIQVNVKENMYWTTGELLAMAQDCEKVFGDPTLDGILSFHGKDTMVADLWKIKEKQEIRPVFRDYYDK